MRLRVVGACAGVAAVVIAGLVWANWARIAVAVAPKKVAAQSRSEAARQADELFWQTLHGGRYDGIQPALELLTAAYLETADDAVTAAHAAWLHVWRVSERKRLASIPATITDDIRVSRRYFQEAVELNSSEARYLGFLASMTLAEGTIDKEEATIRRGYFMLLDAIRAWPEFNLFTGGYVLSQRPANSEQFKEGLEWQWRTLDLCVGGNIDRANPDYAKYMALETKESQKRVCWNSWIAPHNLEGFFLNMGDMLVKSGDWQTARKIYANAKLAHEYPTWPHRDVLEERMQSAEANVAAFNAPPSDDKPVMMKFCNRLYGLPSAIAATADRLFGYWTSRAAPKCCPAPGHQHKTSALILLRCFPEKVPTQENRIDPLLATRSRPVTAPFMSASKKSGRNEFELPRLLVTPSATLYFDFTMIVCLS